MLRAVGGMACIGVLSTSCLVDDDNLCGERWVEADDGSCVCPDDSIVVDGECRRCGSHEEPRDNACVCEEGYARSDDGDCAPEAPAAEGCAGGDCDEGASNSEAGATDAELGGAECSSSAECEDDELCDVYSSRACVPWPDGYGSPCSSDDDCAGTEAEYCELFSSQTCQIDGCKELNGTCPGDLACCDFAILGRSLCIPMDQLQDGACPAPGQLVERGGAQ